MLEDKFDDPDTQSSLSKSDGEKQDNVEGVVQIGYSNSSDSDEEEKDNRAMEHSY